MKDKDDRTLKDCIKRFANSKVLPFSGFQIKKKPMKLSEEITQEMYDLLVEHSKRSLWGNRELHHGGHLGLCSFAGGDPKKCPVCGTTIRTLDLLNKIDLIVTN